MSRITTGDLAFLDSLQKELNTQETFCQADPRFWVVMQVALEDCAENDPVEFVRFVKDGETVSTKAVKYALEEAYSGQLDFGGDGWASDWLYTHHMSLGEDGRIDLFCVPDNDIRNAIDEYVRHFDCEAFYLHEVSRVAENTMFLTYRECVEHIELNGYHYRKPHPYAMTAWRSPQVERLIKILRTADFSCEEVPA